MLQGLLGASDAPNGRQAMGVDGPPRSRPSTDVRAQLERLSPALTSTLPRARKFLCYIVEETLAGRADWIKAYAVWTQVFERGLSFEAQPDPAVRIEAGRLRRAPEDYDLVPGLFRSVIVEVPKGAYVPHFTLGVRARQSIHPLLPPCCPRLPSPYWRKSRSTTSHQLTSTHSSG